MYFDSFDEFTDKKVEFKGRVCANLTAFNGMHITVSFYEKNKDYKQASGFAILDSKNSRIWYKEAEITEDSFVLDASDFDFMSFNSQNIRFKLYLVFDREECMEFCRLYSRPIKNAYLATGDKALLYMDPLAEKTYSGIDLSFIPSCTTSGYIGFILIKKSALLNYMILNTIEDFYVEDEQFCFCVKISKFRSCRDFGITLRSADKDEKRYYDIKPNDIIERETCYELTFRLDRAFLKLKCSGSFTVCSYYELDGYRYPVLVRTKDDRLSKKINYLAMYEDARDNPDPLDFTFHSADGMLRFSTVLAQKGIKMSEENTLDRILFSPDFVASQVLPARFMANRGSYIFRLNMNIDDLSDFSVFIHNSRSKEKIILDVPYYDRKKHEIEVDFSALKENLEDFTATDYFVCLAFSFNGYMYAVKLKATDYATEKKRELPKKFFEPASVFIIHDSFVSVTPFYSGTGYFYVRVQDRLFDRLGEASLQIVDCSVDQDYLYIEVDVTDVEKHFTGFALSYSYKKSEDKRVYFIKGELLARGDRTVLRARTDLSRYELQKTRWMFYAVFMEGEIPYFANIVSREDERNSLKFNYKLLYSEYTHRVDYQNGTTDVFFPYFTENNTLGFMMREENESDSVSFRLKELLALALFKTLKPFYRRKRIVVMYEKHGNTAQDNGYQLFRYCMDHNVEKRINANIYYVMDKESPHFNRVARYKKNLLYFGSFKHMVYMIASRLLVSSEQSPHSYVWLANNSIILKIVKNKKLIYLQNGVTAFRRDRDIPAKSEMPVPFKRFITTSKAETEIVHKYLGYRYDEISDIGFPRWDYLDDKSQDGNELLFIPARRDWVDNSGELEESEYFREYIKLLNSKRLYDILSEYDLRVNFYVHPKYLARLDSFTPNDRINIVSDEIPLNELVMRCKLLMTDYSSVAWDAFYMGKPVLFYQFDYDRYSRMQGSYIDMRKDLFGDRSTTLDGLCDDLEKSAKSGFKLSQKYQLMREHSFTYTDKENCARTVQEIRKLKW